MNPTKANWTFIRGCALFRAWMAKEWAQVGDSSSLTSIIAGHEEDCGITQVAGGSGSDTTPRYLCAHPPAVFPSTASVVINPEGDHP
jgi:hypothetical protein